MKRPKTSFTPSHFQAHKPVIVRKKLPRTKKPDVFYLKEATVLVGQTPQDIRMEHFEEMSKFFGLTRRSFAETIINSDDHQLYQILKDFYTTKDPETETIFPYLSKDNQTLSRLSSPVKEGYTPERVDNLILLAEECEDDAVLTSSHQPHPIQCTHTERSKTLVDETQNQGVKNTLCTFKPSTSSLLIDEAASSSNARPDRNKLQSRSPNFSQLSTFKDLSDLLFGENS